MQQYVQMPVRLVNGERWAILSMRGEQHYFCGERIKKKKENFSFADQHRVRLYVAKKNVHWKITEGVELKMSEVNTARQPSRRR